MEIKDKLKELRENVNLSQSELARRIGIGRDVYCRYESGSCKPSYEKLVKIADYYKVSIDDFFNRTLSTNNNDVFFKYNVIGSVCAGYNGQAIEEYTGEQQIIPSQALKGLSKDNFFVLKVKGDSMYPKLLQGDKVLVQRTSSVDSGSIAIVLYDGNEATIKKVVYENGCNWLELIPLNSNYESKRIEGVELENCRILGKVISLYRDM